ncbi:TfoX/Sxy family protein [Lacibacterium aquatile]|uniref:TfoX/Sxy family protein n=1 Tax=Lacibacterium aquatile TaxID=1168082 RepID=A0ABW5DWU1_9PROT
MPLSPDLLARIEAGAFALGPVRARPMFGGYGVYLDGLMVALVSGGELYLKSGPGNRSEFEALGLPLFTYMREGKRVALGYSLAPDGVHLEPWLEGALAEARRRKRAKPDKKKPKLPSDNPFL